tara:strand:- start:679 stop:963 length:285 start_codon:yes stop_codon:yes gene_type:complete
MNSNILFAALYVGGFITCYLMFRIKIAAAIDMADEIYMKENISLVEEVARCHHKINEFSSYLDSADFNDQIHSVLIAELEVSAFKESLINKCNS